jgi:hypothetical protein
MNHAMSLRRLSMLTVLALLAACLTSVVVTALTGIPAARADTVPPPPPGWTTVFGDDFAGSASSAPSAANWFYDIGTGYGTGEIEHTTNSTSNVWAVTTRTGYATARPRRRPPPPGRQ